MTKNIKALLEKNAAANIQKHRESAYSEEVDLGRKHTKIPLERIDPNPFQPRLVFHEEELRKLAESIAATGLTNPVTVRPVGDRYQLIAGERRFRAHGLLNKPTIEAIVMDVEDDMSAAMALAENINRADLTDFEIAEGIRTLSEKFPKRKHLAEALDLQRSDLYRYLAYHELPGAIRDRLRVKPSLLGRAAASDLAQALKAMKDEEGAEARALHAIDLLEAGKIDQKQVCDQLRRKAGEPTPSRAPSPKAMALQRSGTKVGTFARTATGFVVKLNEAIPDDKAERIRLFVEQVLEEGAE